MWEGSSADSQRATALVHEASGELQGLRSDAGAPGGPVAQDLEGVRLLEVGFELEALLLTGQCIDIAAKTREQVRQRRP